MTGYLLLDIGNSRLKWGWSEGEQLSHYGSAARDDTLFETLANSWQQLPRPEQILAANVAGDAFAQHLSHWVNAYWQRGVEYVTVAQGSGGLEIAYPDPRLFGVDRWLALLAARHRFQGALCVIDCGTAVTIDAVAASGKHLGGVIVPGIALMQSSLLQRSGGVSRGVESHHSNSNNLLGCDTRSGIERGALYAVAGAIVHTLSRIKAEMGQPITTIITGGDAEAVLEEIGDEFYYAPHLVLHGVQLLAGRS